MSCESGGASRCHLPHEGRDIAAALEHEVGANLAIDGMLDNDVAHGHAIIDHRVELRAHLLRRMAASDRLDDTRIFFKHPVAARRRENLCALGTQDADVSHDDLPAHAELFRELRPRPRTVRAREELQELLPSFFCRHGFRFLLCKLPITRAARNPAAGRG